MFHIQMDVDQPNETAESSQKTKSSAGIGQTAK